MKTSFNHTTKHDDGGGKLKSPQEASAHAQYRNQGQLAFKSQEISIFSPNLLRIYKPIEHFTLLRLPINEVFNNIKGQSWVSTQNQSSTIPYFLE